MYGDEEQLTGAFETMRPPMVNHQSISLKYATSTLFRTDLLSMPMLSTSISVGSSRLLHATDELKHFAKWDLKKYFTDQR